MTEQLLPQCIPEQYAGLKPYPTSKHVNNCTDKEGFSFKMENPQSGRYASPVCYYSDLYQKFLSDCGKMEQLGPWLKGMLADAFERVAVEAAAGRVCDQGYSYDPSNIFISMVNTEANRKFLETVPHREFMDLSITYRYFVGNHNGSVQDISITNEFASGNLGMDEARLYEAAIANTPKIFPFETQWVSEIIGLKHEEDMVDPLYLSTDCGLYGPAAMFYPDVLQAAAAKVGGDAFIIPSSEYELLVVNAKALDGEAVADMVFEVNSGQLEPENRLSNGAYFFDSKSKTISPATDYFRPLSENMGGFRPIPSPSAYSPQQTQHGPRI